MFNKVLEMSRRMSKGGRKKIKMVLLTIHKDGETNRNGITWVEQYVLDNLESIKGIPICASFLDDDKEVLFGHGYTETVEVDGKSEPLFLDSETVGVIEYAKIEDIEIDGKIERVLVGYGYLYCQRYPKLCTKLQNDIETSFVKSSIEIMGTDENNCMIIYDGGWKETGRKPMVFDFSGTCLLGVLEADENCYVLEVAENQNKGENKMDEKLLREIITNTITEINSKNDELNSKIAELEALIETKDSEINELSKAKETLELNSAEKETKFADMQKENEELKAEIKENKKKELNSALDEMLSVYTDEQKVCVESEINAYKENPFDNDADAIISKICVEIVKKQMEDAKFSEQNSFENKEDLEDIFTEINSVENEEEENVNIF